MGKVTGTNIVFINDKIKTYRVGYLWNEFCVAEKTLEGCFLPDEILDSCRGLSLFVSKNNRDTGSMIKALEEAGYKKE